MRYAEDGDGSIPADTFGRAKLAGAVSELARVLAVAQRLRAPGGCPWDREQSVRSLAPALVEEAFEAVDGLDELARTGDARGAVEELGDLLFSIALLCQVASEEGVFDLERAARGAAEKIVRRHPHVYGEAKDLSSDAALAQWERIKAEERAARGRDDTSALSGVPRALPALQRAARLGAKAMALGFRWESADGALAKVREEVLELDEAYRGDDRGALERELGDVLLATSQFANYVGVDPETAARDAAHRFETRFRAMEQELGDGAGHADLERWMDAWRRAKARTT
ncbi:MAG: nucleoside triphosphate pyrophosphohydrolase [Planctomycetota bacterium]